jgi:hypothetical protein
LFGGCNFEGWASQRETPATDCNRVKPHPGACPVRHKAQLTESWDLPTETAIEISLTNTNKEQKAQYMHLMFVLTISYQILGNAFIQACLL